MNETKLRKRNFLSLMFEGTFFFTGLAFIDVNAVIPVFIYAYTNSLKLAGLAATINLAASTVAQTLVGPYVKSIKHVPSYIIKAMFLFRPLPLLMIPVLLSSLPASVVVLVFLLIYALLFAGDGLVVVPWTDLFGRTVSPDKRGSLLGFQQLFGGIGGLGAGFIIKSVLEHSTWENDTRYAIIFGLAAVSLIISSVAMTFARDLPRPVVKEAINHRQYYTRLPTYLKKNKTYLRSAIIRVLTSITSMIAPLMILFGKNLIGLDDRQVSTLVYVQIIGNLIGGVLWGSISSRFGNKYVIMANQVVGLTIPFFAMICLLLQGSGLAFHWLWPIILANGMNMSSWVGFLNYTMDVVHEEERTVYLLLNSLIIFPLTILSFLAGLIADLVGFIPLFSISICTASTGLFLARKLLSPRKLSESDPWQIPDDV